MRYIKIVHKGACRFVAINDAAKLDKFINNGWEPAIGADGRYVITTLNTARESRNLSNRTNDILANIQQVIDEESLELDELVKDRELLEVDET